jgi:hypothetical protein
MTNLKQKISSCLFKIGITNKDYMKDKKKLIRYIILKFLLIFL